MSLVFMASVLLGIIAGFGIGLSNDRLQYLNKEYTRPWRALFLASLAVMLAVVARLLVVLWGGV